jgi:translation initiation factor IF-2
MALRVYELSKQLGISNKELLKLLADAGFVYASHMAVLGEDALAYVKRSASSSSSKVEASTSKPEPVVVNPVEKVPSTVAPAPFVAPRAAAPVARQQPQLSRQAQPGRQSGPTHRSGQGGRSTPASRPGDRKPQDYRQSHNETRRQPEVESQVAARSMTVGEFADQVQRPLSDVILALLKRGIAATRNQVIAQQTVVALAQAMGIKVVNEEQQERQALKKSAVGRTAATGGVERPPIVVVIGHVDHGKTSLLDFIRKTRVAAREKGGITQHLGAYKAQTPHGDIVFLDTPGHEAFSMMRERGVRIADIAILVVAADDGVMPQTVEALSIAKSVGLPIIVAINKIDKATSVQIEAVKRTLTQYELISEDWGGQTVMMPISAKLGTGVSELLDVVALQAQLMELSADASATAHGYVLESKMEKGRGAVATVVCHTGTLRVGDWFIAGQTRGRVSSLINWAGVRVQKALPAEPVLVAGFDAMPAAGDELRVVAIAEYKNANGRLNVASSGQPSYAAAEQVTTGQATEVLRLILKADGVSSQEALVDALAKLSGKTFKKVVIVYAGVGPISERDVKLAATTKAFVYGLHVRAEHSALLIAQKSNVEVRIFDIIYKLLEDVQLVAEQGKPVKKSWKKLGEALVLKVFPIKGVGVIAGCVMRSGRCTKECKVVGWRGKHKIGEGLINSLQREKKQVKEVHTGFEFGFLVNGMEDWQPDDRVEFYLESSDEAV